jgi:hypothetical protein
VPDLDDLPVLVKPATRGDPGWSAVERPAKAVRVQDRAGLRAVWAQLCAYGTDILVQQIVPGSESAIKSYHCYVDRSGALVADATGRKLRMAKVDAKRAPDGTLWLLEVTRGSTSGTTHRPGRGEPPGAGLGRPAGVPPSAGVTGAARNLLVQRLGHAGRPGVGSPPARVGLGSARRVGRRTGDG